MTTTPSPSAPRKFKDPWVSQLEILIKGREQKDEWVDDSVTAGTTVEVVHIPVVQGLITFKVRADTSCKAIYHLLQQAQDPQNKLEVVPGPRGGLRLGVNGKFDPKLNLMVKK